MPGSVVGPQAKFHYLNSDEKVINVLDRLIEGYENEGLNDFVILTCKTESRSVLSNFIIHGRYKEKYRVSTCRKFKGLEADIVILVDVTAELFKNNNILLYYVGTSRARFRLEILGQMTNDDCEMILKDVFSIEEQIRQPQKELADRLNTIGIKGK